MDNSLSLSLPEGLLVVEPIGSLASLEEEATFADRASLEGITSSARRAERLAWRRVLRRVEGEACEVFYTEQGAPCLKNSHYQHISVSHCADLVAVVFAQSPCGVDVERVERNFERVARRYVSATEQALVTGKCDLAAIWCAKEAIYKMMGRVGVDFVRDIEILSINFPHGEIVARASDIGEIRLGLMQPDSEHILAYTK